MTAYPSRMYRDPMIVLMEKQAHEARKSCAGCDHERAVVSPFGDTLIRCVKGKPYGKKCGQYEVRT